MLRLDWIQFFTVEDITYFEDKCSHQFVYNIRFRFDLTSEAGFGYFHYSISGFTESWKEREIKHLFEEVVEEKSCKCCCKLSKYYKGILVGGKLKFEYSPECCCKCCERLYTPSTSSHE